MPSYKMTVARRMICVYIVVVTCLFVAHFKTGQNYVLSLDTFFSCDACTRNNDDTKEDDIVETTAPIDAEPTQSSNRLFQNIRNKIKEENQDGLFFETAVEEPDPIRKQKGNSEHGENDIDLTETENYTPDTTVTGDSEWIEQDKIKGVSLRENAKTKGSANRYRFKPPPNEKPIRRFPQALIIGFAKCGTRALLEFLELHPYIAHHEAEMHFYDRNETWAKGFEWYRQQMPPSYSNQITMEKTPAYITHQRARDEIFRLTPKAKLILLVRDPVVRLVSQFLLRYRNELPNEDIPVEVIYRDKFTGKFLPEYRPVVTGIYHRHLAMWLQRFPRKQFLILNGEELSTNPIRVLKQVEHFLDIPPMFEERNFYFNKTSGFFCPRGFGPDAVPKCLGKTKGVPHPKLPPQDEKMLYKFYGPHNEHFFRLAGRRFEWTEKWERYQ